MSAAPAMKVNAIAPYFGGKRTLAPRIVAELGPHQQYFEPFCGSLAVLFAKEPSQKETANDLHGDVTNLALVLSHLDYAAILYERLQRVLFCEGVLKEAHDFLEKGSTVIRDFNGDLVFPDVERAYWFFIASWMSRKGFAGCERINYQIAVRWTKGGGSSTVAFRNSVESIPAWHDRLRNVVITSRDAFKIIPKFEDAGGTVIYCDPPYTAESRGKLTGSDGRYKHEFHHNSTLMDRDDHARLAEQLRAFKKARIIVSYYDCPRVRDLYKGWTFVELPAKKSLANANARGEVHTEANELLIINGKCLVEENP